MKRKAELILFMAVAFLCASSPPTVAEASESGNTVDEVLGADIEDRTGTADSWQWELDENGCLTLSGKYEGYAEGMPWMDRKDEIKSAKVSMTGITSLNELFKGCENLISVDFTGTDTSNVTDMCNMFSECYSLKELDLSNFNTSNVMYMDAMFSDCYSLEELDLGSFNTSKVTDMGCMFQWCKNLKKLNIDSFDTSNVTNMSYMFNGCESLEQIDLSSFHTSRVTDMNGMFSSCDKLEKLDVNNFDTSSVTDMGWMFNGCRSISRLDVSSFDTSNVKNMELMFSSCWNLSELDVSSFDTSNVINMDSMFKYCGNLTELDLSNFNLENLESADETFGSCGLQSLKTPYNLKINMSLPLKEDYVKRQWSDMEGNAYTSLPANQNTSITLTLIYIHTADDPRVTQDVVNIGKGGIASIPIELGKYAKDDLWVSLQSIGENRNYFAQLEEKEVKVSFPGNYDVCNAEPPQWTKAGNYKFKLKFYLEKSTGEAVSEDVFTVAVPTDSEMWSVTPKTVKYDGSQDIGFSFRNGSNYCALQSISKVQIFVSKSGGNPVLTEGFTYDMDTGSLHIDGAAVKDALIKMGWGNLKSGKFYINAWAVTDTGEEILFNQIANQQEGWTEPAWALDFTGFAKDVDLRSECKKVLERTKISKSAVNLYTGTVNHTVTIKPIYPQNFTQTLKAANLKIQSVTYRASNPKKVSVSKKGVVTGLKAGNITVTTTVTLSDGSKKVLQTKVTVKNPYLKIYGKQSVKKGKTLSLKVKTYGVSKKVTWSVNNNKIAKINAKTGKLTAKKAGNVIVTAKAGKVKGKCKVKVKK